MTLVPAKQKQGANFVRMNANPTNATKARPIAIAATTIAAPRIRHIATALSSRMQNRTPVGNFYRDSAEASVNGREFLLQELARAMLILLPVTLVEARR
jgi:hypothetical protein